MKEVVLDVGHSDDDGDGDDDEDVRIDSSDPFRPNPFYFDIILIKISWQFRDKFVTKVYTMSTLRRMFEDEEGKDETVEDQSFFLFITGTYPFYRKFIRLSWFRTKN